ncbi:endoglucanase [Flavobacterium aquaticum]|uniref:Endoglucanase n=1 Tax=Flavobacterium aquaticum TaxID=1236486 RepID=A0A327YVV1_9FLAO|nr:T9SS type A sorting domain-containing protein [Flavobacterium aquaticum]RAK25133.1 endoglucanase [Flavobacterium aquaticum]
MKKITFFLSLMFCSLSFSQNLVTNGDFQTGASTPWYGNAANVVDLGASNFVNQANVLAAGNPYDVNLSQNINLTSGLTYELTFTAFTDATTSSRNIIVGLGQNNAPWAALTSTTALTATPQTFSYQYTINYGDAVADRVIFDLGAATGFVFIDNVSVVQVVNTCSNGIQDGTETGIDCGGSCAPCIVSPTVAAPTPPARPSADVVSIYSDAYTNIAFDNFDAGWCGGAASTQVQIAGNNTLRKNTGVVCQGIDFQSNRQNLTDFTHIHFDFYITDTDLTGDVFNVKLVHFNGTGGEVSALEVNINGGTTPQLVANQWVSVDVPITALGGVVAGNLNRSDIAQIGITTAMVDNVWYDNIYLHKNTVLSSESFNVSKVKLYPNPTSNILNVESAGNIQNIAVYNVLGQEVLNRATNGTFVNLDVSNLNVGIYVIKTMIDGNVSSTKFIKE